MERDTTTADTRVEFSPKMNCNRGRLNTRAYVNQLLPMDAVPLIHHRTDCVAFYQ